MRALFYIDTFLAKREPGTPRVHAADLFPNIKEKMRSKLGTCKINDCTIIEARKPLKFFNSLFLFRTNANTISCSAIAHIQDALNGKEVDWLRLFYEYLKAELITLKEELYKDKTTILRTLVGPPITMLLASGGFLTVQQEIGAGMLLPSQLEEKAPNKKRKLEDKMEHTDGNSSKGNPQILIANMEPAITNNVLISTPAAGASYVHPAELHNIHQKLSQTCQQLQNWITETSANSV